MNTVSTAAAFESIRWPDGLQEQTFLDEYWQKKPLLIRQAFPHFETPLSADELAGLSLEQDIASKLITCDDQDNYLLQYGPFDESRFENMSDERFSLLVTDIEKVLPEMAMYLEPFRFLPDWRIDDLMISYAPDGSSVGAHVDEYDVFLLQASGRRYWSIDSRPDTTHLLREHGDLKILQEFNPTDSWELVPGDMLYLPPGIAHHGVARGNHCTTWSVGFRAPLASELLSRVSELLSEKMKHRRFTDGSLQQAVAGEISAGTIAQFKQFWDEATSLTNDDFADILGQWLTESTVVPDLPNVPSVELPSDTAMLCKAPFSRFAWIENSHGDTTLYVDGLPYACRKALATQLCRCSHPMIIDFQDTTDKQLIHTLIGNGNLLTGSWQNQ